MATPDELFSKHKVLAKGVDKPKGTLECFNEEFSCKTCCEKIAEDAIASPCACGPVHLACFCTGVYDSELYSFKCRHCGEQYKEEALLGGTETRRAFLRQHLLMAIPFVVLILVLNFVDYTTRIGDIHWHAWRFNDQIDTFFLLPLLLLSKLAVACVTYYASRLPAMLADRVLTRVCADGSPHVGLRLVILSSVCFLTQSSACEHDLFTTLVTLGFWAQLRTSGINEEEKYYVDARRTAATQAEQTCKVPQLEHFLIFQRFKFFYVLCQPRMWSIVLPFRRHSHFFFLLVAVEPMCRFGSDYFWSWITKYHADKVRVQLEALEAAAAAAEAERLRQEKEEEERIEKEREEREELARRMDDNRERAAALGAIAGSVTGATTGGVAGMGVGSVMGAAVGVPLALFTFGLSIPACAFVGGGSGAAVGTAAGMASGCLSGGAVGYGAGTLLKMKASRF
eukprot:TRINITY_DN6404_c0_g2_i1.p1 TRINITY_DN6404_c0_g2~~TRINITY_DN6404_c0_g2_i1.p1  ORF type:complete len:454 (+),score=110.93 TRINITY_DN6404_c0_g2_i1:57-1418(+)